MHSVSIHYAFRQSTPLNEGTQNLPIQLKITHNGLSGTVVSPASRFANVWGLFPNCFRLISSWKNEVAYTCVSLNSLLKAKGLTGRRNDRSLLVYLLHVLPEIFWLLRLSLHLEKEVQLLWEGWERHFCLLFVSAWASVFLLLINHSVK